MLLILLVGIAPQASTAAAPGWRVGEPVVTYWCGPSMTEATASQMAAGGFNLVWCTEAELDVAHRHHLRAQLTHPLLSPESLDTPARRAELDQLIARVKSHPALYAYFITDEPNATNFPALGRILGHLREHDPAHLAYINLFPTYATNDQLGNHGDVTNAYRAHLSQYVRDVHPSLLSYDHYQFSVKGDNDQYFLNLALVRERSLLDHLPFLNIVQAATWTKSMRIPREDEMRFLVYTTLAYGAEGISYYIYACAGHEGGIATLDGTPTSLYLPLSALNREFVAVARSLQGLRSTGVYHAGMLPPGAVPPPADLPLFLEPRPESVAHAPGKPVKGVLLGLFAPAGETRDRRATHAVVVNLDYGSDAVVGIGGRRKLEVLEPGTGAWRALGGRKAELHLPRGGGALVRLTR